MTREDSAGDAFDETVDAAVEEYAELLSDGAAPNVDDFLTRHPHIAAAARPRIVALRAARAAIDELEASAGALDPTDTPASTKVLGDYRILREIGRGGMGVVYLAEQLSLRRTVAIKVLPAHITLQVGAIERFRREAATAARLRHPGIVSIHAVGEEAGAHFFAMDFVEGRSLDKQLSEWRETRPGPRAGSEGSSARPRTRIERVCQWGIQIADALEHAHRSGVIHRDVKPSNILIREDGAALLSDFGLARASGFESLTITGDFAGSPYYVSPEQASAGRLSVDHRTDVYSLGVTLYEGLTLRRPFDGASATDILARIETQEPTRLRRLNPAIPRDLETIVLKAIEKRPERRYATAGALMEDLRAFLAWKPIAARPPSIATQIGKWARRHRAAAAVGIAGTTAAIASAIVWWSQPGWLAISSSTRGAFVIVDGERHATPLAPLALAPGVHRVRFEKEEERLFTPEESVVVPRGRTTALDRSLVSRDGVLHLESDPPRARATVLDEAGATVASKTCPAMVTLPAGKYRVRFELDGAELREELVEVALGGAVTHSVAHWDNGELALASFQAGLQVDLYRGDRVAGTPWRSLALPIEAPLRLPAGKYAARARLREHDRHDFSGSQAFRVEPAKSMRGSVWAPPLVRKLDVAPTVSPLKLALGDIDGDGLPEVVVGTLEGTLTAYRLGGATALDSRILGNSTISALMLADFDGDDEREIVAGSTAGAVLALRSDGSKRFKVNVGSGVTRLLGLRAADGELHMFVATQVGVAAVDSKGTVCWQEHVGEFVSSLGAIDWDGDGTPEILASSDQRIVVFRRNGSRAFEQLAPATAVSSLGLDLDSDGRGEIVMAGPEGVLTALAATGERRFSVPLGSWATIYGAIDLDGDGHPEIFAGTRGGSVAVLSAEGARRFGTRVSGGVAAMVFADLDGDGLLELVVGSDEGQVLALDADGTHRFESQSRGAITALEADDLDGDGRDEIVGASRFGPVFALAIDPTARDEIVLDDAISSIAPAGSAGERPTVVAGTEGGSVHEIGADLVPEKRGSLPGRINDLELADLDGDGDPEIYVAYVASTSPCLGVLERGRSQRKVPMSNPALELKAARLASGEAAIAAAQWPKGVEVFVASGERRLFLDDEALYFAVADLDGDGADEFLCGSSTRDAQGPPTLTIHPGSGSAPIKIEGTKPLTCIGAVDLFGNGRSEIVAGFAGPPREIVVMSPTGEVRFRQPTNGGPCAARALDLDGDGSIELVVGTDFGWLYAFASNGSLRFRTGLGETIVGFELADLDGDGSVEILAVTSGGALAVLAADGSVRVHAQRAAEIRRLAVCDLDRDGTLEAVVAEGRRIAVYRDLRPDPRAAVRTTFLSALEAAERGDETVAAAGARDAKLRWLPLGASNLAAIRARLLLAGRTSPSMSRMAAVFERVRPLADRAAIDVIEALAERAAFGIALEIPTRSLAHVSEDLGLAFRLNDVARNFVNPEAARPEGFALALVLAEAAVRASGRENANILATYAESLHVIGRAADAVEIEEEALRKVPPEDEYRSLRERLESSLRRYLLRDRRDR